jgi:DNA-binding response OmpR family regulator
MPKRILVVEDDPIGRKMLSDYLRAHGYDVSVAVNGAEGVAKAASERPDLVVCDVALPKKSGFEVCFDVKRAPETRDVPVILVSAVCKDAHSEFYAAVDLRAQGYFVKPFSMSAMLDRIRSLLPA